MTSKYVIGISLHTKGVRVNTFNAQKIRLENTEIEEVESFLYQGSLVS